MNFWQQLEERRPEARFSLGLQRVSHTLDAIGRPERTFKTILVAGTNGKGSTTRFLEQILLQAKVLVGSYSSPHLFSPGERVRVNGQDSTKDELECYAKPLLERFPDLTYFELLTVAAAQIFADRQVEWAIFEIGLGGRLDACNALDNVVATAITGIDYDHMQVLGNTLTAITAEKAAIIRPNCPLVTGDLPSEAEQVIAQVVKQRAAWRLPRQQLILPAWDGPEYLLHNLGVALALADVLGFSLDSRHWPSLLKSRPFGRWSVVAEQPLKVIDGAHNQQGVRVVGQAFAERCVDRAAARLWFGAGATKDLQGMVAELNVLGLPVVAVQLGHNGEWHSAEAIKKLLQPNLYQGVQTATTAVQEFWQHSGPALWLGSLRGLQIFSNLVAG